jgi:hypothetical protein
MAFQESAMRGSVARKPDLGPDVFPGTAVPARRARAIVAVSLAAVVGVAVWVGFTATRPRPDRPIRDVRLLDLDRPFPPEGRYPSDPYVGPRACAECHPDEFALYSRSGHAQTLNPPRRRAIARRLDGTTVADPELDGVQWSYRYRDGQLYIRREARDRVDEGIAEYAFGSGRHGLTFVNLIDPGTPKILEHRLSYYTQQQALGLTAGHDERPRPPDVTRIGRVPPPADARRCFGCHSTQTSARDDRPIDEETLIPNVSCERCHGPGRAHVQAARRGASDVELQLPFGPDRFTADSLLTLCGTCHRHPSGSNSGGSRPDDLRLVRFQPVGIIESRCFRESGGAFSCVTCHDPHARPSSDRASYLEVCLPCHGGTGSADRATALGAPCRVAPRGDCVDCHMPRVLLGRNVRLTDHWIRVRRPGDPAHPTQVPAPNPRPLDPPEP